MFAFLLPFRARLNVVCKKVERSKKEGPLRILMPFIRISYHRSARIYLMIRWARVEESKQDTVGTPSASKKVDMTRREMRINVEHDVGKEKMGERPKGEK
jgi:hypothetical protein